MTTPLCPQHKTDACVLNRRLYALDHLNDDQIILWLGWLGKATTSLYYGEGMAVNLGAVQDLYIRSRHEEFLKELGTREGQNGDMGN